ncbi:MULTISPECIES: type II toxin-antitoxin system RelE/ParE family toxin [Xanthomonas]|uniref:Type II toxin-antitoxin system RelE/ParE family toxin n=1 Tax=Xanthomonas protegens TaxID=3380705 RepID=A0ABU9LE92_9XANT|nr:type II toxin-antitoxin system RelE/ParE family toxin [Xanthomonas sp. LMG 12461]KAB7762075.1 hypothetical protein CEK68_19465 [Xanthomonas sp. LMG 12461]
MTWVVELLTEAQEFFDGLSGNEQIKVAGAMQLLAAKGPTLGRPHVDRIHRSRHHNMKELRVQCADKQFRIFFAFDTKRRGILLVGGDKIAYGVDEFYEEFIPIADDLLDAHLDKTNAADMASKVVAKKTKGRRQQ